MISQSIFFAERERERDLKYLVISAFGTAMYEPSMTYMYNFVFNFLILVRNFLYYFKKL